MIVNVKRDGHSLYSYDTEKDALCIFPGIEDRSFVIQALREASRFVEGSMSGEHPLLILNSVRGVGD